MEIKECERYVRSRLQWLTRTFGKTISHKQFCTTVQARVQELYRDGLIILRRIQILDEENEDDSRGLEELYNTYRFTSIPIFMEFLEFTNRRK
jgi:hypothetical protein